MKALYLRYSLFFISVASSSILIAQEVVSSSGANGSSPTTSISWTLGEVAVESYHVSPTLLTQGLHQPILGIITELDELQDLSVQLTVFPNPTSSTVELSLGTPPIEGWRYVLSDNRGTVLKEGVIESLQTMLSLAHYPPSLYHLQVIDNNKRQKLFKITKQ